MAGTSAALRGRSGAICRTPSSIRRRISGLFVYMPPKTPTPERLFRPHVEVSRAGDATFPGLLAPPDRRVANPSAVRHRWSGGTRLLQSSVHAVNTRTEHSIEHPSSRLFSDVRLVTWNVAGRVGAQPEQTAALMSVAADLVALQEVTRRTELLWASALAAAGFVSIESAVDRLPAPPTRRRLAVLTAARLPLTPLPAP